MSLAGLEEEPVASVLGGRRGSWLEVIWAAWLLTLAWRWAAWELRALRSRRPGRA
ncbi:MAG: hypothetical protein PHF00_05070 [Elusimicrobia bacterium]|nr:hypothetical protein [Elusimicrobiota bacterium]